MTPLDIGGRDLETVLRILREHVPEHPVRAFGSRVRGTARRTSDLDLAIMTDRPLGAARTAALRDAFSESDLPWKVDLLDWAETGEDFRMLVDAEAVLVKGRAEGGR